MKSCLYECQILHARFAPRVHRFAYRIFLFAIDLDAFDTLPLWGKRVPWFAKAARLTDQRALYRPHRSLQPSDVA